MGLFCETYPDLEDRQLKKIKAEFPGWLGELNLQRRDFVLKEELGGGIIACRNLDDPQKYLSTEYAWQDGMGAAVKNDWQQAQSRSRHPGGVQAVMCDGSVRTIRDTISRRVWWGVSGRDDGFPVE